MSHAVFTHISDVNPIVLVLAAALVVILVRSVRIAEQYERAVVFRLGR